MIRLALSGAHGTGKTTLAKALAGKHGLYFLETSVRKVHTELGTDPSKAMSFEVRAKVQEKILENMVREFSEIPSKVTQTGFVADRSFGDLVTYALNDFDGTWCADWFEDYVGRCCYAAGHFYDTVVILPPGVKGRTEQEAYKGSVKEPVINKFHFLLMGVHHNYQDLYKNLGVILEGVLDLEKRVEAIEHILTETEKPQTGSKVYH